MGIGGRAGQGEGGGGWPERLPGKVAREAASITGYLCAPCNLVSIKMEAALDNFTQARIIAARALQHPTADSPPPSPPTPTPSPSCLSLPPVLSTHPLIHRASFHPPRILRSEGNPELFLKIQESEWQGSAWAASE